MHRELGPFANQIGYHNTKSIRSIELTVFHKDDNPVPKISALDKAYYKQVESVKVILAKRHKIHKVDLGIDQKTEWVKFRIGMMNMMRKMGKTMVKQQQQGAGWKVADCREKTLVYSKGDYGLMSKVWLLDRLRTAPKVYKKKNVADSEDPLLASEEVAGQGGVDVSEGSVDSEATKVGGLSMDMEDTAIRTGLPTSDTMPEPDSNATAKMGIGKDCWRLLQWMSIRGCLHRIQHQGPRQSQRPSRWSLKRRQRCCHYHTGAAEASRTDGMSMGEGK